jgi:hypothetical protein
MLEFDAIDRIVETGYRCALEGTAGWEVLREVSAIAPGT